MKKSILLLLIFSALIISCNDDDKETETNYSVTIEQQNCNGTQTSFCISEQEKNRIETLIENNPNDPCVWISITDINDIGHNGYYRNSGTDSDNICN